MRLLPLRTLDQALALLGRYRTVPSFGNFVQERIGLVLLINVFLVLMSVACGIGVLAAFAVWHPLLLLPGILLLPFAIAGSFAVLAYVFFSWIESRSLLRELGSRHRPPPGPVGKFLFRAFGADLRPFPAVPWTLAVLLFFLPLGLLISFWLGAGLVVIACGMLLPLVYASLEDRMVHREEE